MQYTLQNRVNQHKQRDKRVVYKLSYGNSEQERHRMEVEVEINFKDDVKKNHGIECARRCREVHPVRIMIISRHLRLYM